MRETADTHPESCTYEKRDDTEKHRLFFSFAAGRSSSDCGKDMKVSQPGVPDAVVHGIGMALQIFVRQQ